MNHLQAWLWLLVTLATSSENMILPTARAQTQESSGNGDGPVDEDDPAFMGYHKGPKSIEPMWAGRKWTTRGSFAGDCFGAEEPCPIATGCIHGTVFYNNGETGNCVGDQDCVKMSILQASPAGPFIALNYACRGDWFAHTLYREYPSETSSTLASTPSGTSNSGVSPSSTTSILPGISQFTPTTTSLDAGQESTNTTTSTTDNRAWIAGAVVGSLAVVGILLFLAFKLGKRQRRRALSPPAGDQQQFQPQPPYGGRHHDRHQELPSVSQPQMIYTKPLAHELPASHGINELRSVRASTGC